MATDDDEVEGYVAEGEVAGLSADHGLVDVEEVANVVLHAVDDPVEVPCRNEVPAAPIVGLDLWEFGDARDFVEGQRLFTAAVEVFRARRAAACR